MANPDDGKAKTCTKEYKVEQLLREDIIPGLSDQVK